MANRMPALMKFYTTAAQERVFEEQYQQLLKVKQAELDAQRQLQKYTARAYIHEPERRFDVSHGVVTMGGEPCPASHQPGGFEYCLDPHFAIAQFVEENPCYSVIFKPSGRYGPTVNYWPGLTPAYLVAADGSAELVADDENKYDIGCG
jgi:hypothetical protein